MGVVVLSKRLIMIINERMVLMRGLLRRLIIDKFVVHDIPSKFSVKSLKENPGQRNLEPKLSDIETPFSDKLQKFFHNKIKESIGSPNSFDIEYIDKIKKVPNEIDRFFNDSNTLIDMSQNIANHLYYTQNARNPGGLLLFIVCHAGDRNAIAILKVEREEGVQIQRETTIDGYKHFRLDHIQNLIFTDKTKLFKIVLFYKEERNTMGILSDQQMGYNNGKDVANYFLNDFLGCKLTKEPSVQTKKFFEITQEYINESNMNSEEKDRVITHLVSALTNNSNTINPRYFAENCLKPQYADTYIDLLKEKEVDSYSFVKDISLISNRLKHSEYIFQSGIKVMGLKEEIQNHLFLSSLGNGMTKVEIVDLLEKVSSK